MEQEILDGELVGSMWGVRKAQAASQMGTANDKYMSYAVVA